MLTDVVLEVGGELFHAHRVVLAAASPYFKAMFTGGLKESEMSRVTLQGVSPTAMSRLINFIYTGRIKVNEITVCQILSAATMFQVCQNACNTYYKILCAIIISYNFRYQTSFRLVVISSRGNWTPVMRLASQHFPNRMVA